MKFVRNDDSEYSIDIRASKFSDRISHRSKAQAKIIEKIAEILPHSSILEEFPIEVKRGKTLFYDAYVPQLKVAIEYHGQQHFKFNKFFHSDKSAFIKQKKNDLEKQEFSYNNNIRLIVIDNEDINLIELRKLILGIS